MQKPQFETYLTILQRAEYDLEWFEQWVETHPQISDQLKPDALTSKLQLISIVASCLVFLPIWRRIWVATWLLSPLDWILKSLTLQRAQAKLRRHQKAGLQVVVIAGSYAKTSTKLILKHCLADQIELIATPKSFNVPLGFSQTILNDLKPSTKLFVVELGEFKPNDLKPMMNFIRPDWAILTPVGRQHLVRFGSFEEVVANFKHVLDFFGEQLKDKVLIAQTNTSFFKNLNSYGDSKNNQWRFSNAKVTTKGTSGLVSNQNWQQAVFCPLFGEHQLLNFLPSLWLARQLQLDLTQVCKRLASQPYIEHRHQPFFGQNNVLILDNGYNSNPDSIDASIKLLHQLRPSQKILITPGFVELGAQSESIHIALGKKLALTLDYLGVVESPVRRWIEQGWLESKDKSSLILGKNQTEIIQKLQTKLLPGAVIIFENGVNEVYL